MIPKFRAVIHKHKSQATFADGTKKPVNEKLIDVKAISAADKLFYTCYFSMTTIIMYQVIKDKPWLPWYLGGASDNVSIMSGFDNIPFTPMDEKLYFIGLLLLG